MRKIIFIFYDFYPGKPPIEKLNAALLEASESGKLSGVASALDHGADIECFSGNLQNPLQVAALSGHLDVVKYLVEKGANLEALHESGEKLTALHYAALNSKLDVLEYLIEKKANIETKDMSEMTPLKSTAWRGIFDSTRCLADHGADINTICGWLGKNGIHLTISSNGGKIIYLRNNQASPLTENQ